MTPDAEDARPSPEDPNRFAEGGSAPLDEGPDATPTDHTTEPEEGSGSLPPGAGTKPE
jgi:hypothetical protein